MDGEAMALSIDDRSLGVRGVVALGSIGSAAQAPGPAQAGANMTRQVQSQVTVPLPSLSPIVRPA